MLEGWWYDSDGYCGYFETLVYMVVDGGGEGAKFLTRLIFKILDGFREVLLCDERVHIGGIAHGFTLSQTLLLWEHGQGGLLFCRGVCLQYFHNME